MFHYYYALLLKILATKSTKMDGPYEGEKFDKSTKWTYPMRVKYLTSPQEWTDPTRVKYLTSPQSGRTQLGLKI